MYITNSNRAKAASQLRWYFAKDVLAYLHELKDYMLSTHGKLSSTYLPTLRPVDTSMLFGPAVRFPEDTVLICEGIGKWNSRLQQLQLLSSIITHGHRLQRQYKDIPTLGDAELALLSSIDDAISTFEEADCFVDRTEFENRYQLVWEPSDNHIDFSST